MSGFFDTSFSGCFFDRASPPPWLSPGRSILTQNGVIYMSYCEKSYPTKLAYTYLEEIAKEFEMQYGPGPLAGPTGGGGGGLGGQLCATRGRWLDTLGCLTSSGWGWAPVSHPTGGGGGGQSSATRGAG